MGNPPAMANPIQERFAEVLHERIRQDQYPSTTHMDMLEAVAPPRQLGQYLAHLMERIESEPHPSISMMQRVQNISGRF
jgi:hypothetical protein